MSPETSAPAAEPVGHLWIDASAGVAGDMLLGALVDAGADLDSVQEAIDAVLPATVQLVARVVTRAGLRALKVEVHHLVDDQPHRTWCDIRSLLTKAPLQQEVRAASLTVFGLLAEAEARVHGVDVDAVHFHEVGSWDSIADIVGTACAVHLLGAGTVSASPVALGSGRADTAHGDVPVPAPATLQLATGWSVRSGGEGELATPTGMALIRGLASRCEELPPLLVDAIGVGAGNKDLPGRPNVVRVVRGVPPGAAPDTPTSASPAATEAETEQLWILEANVDDLDPRVWPEVIAALLAAGAADAWLTPILMKKGRPAHTLSVLCSASRQADLRDLVFTLTTTFGVRQHQLTRSALRREWRPVLVQGRRVQVKISTDPDGRIRHVTPEFEEAARVARETGRPLRQVLHDAAAAAVTAGLEPGARIT